MFCLLVCPKHGVVTERVSWAEHDSRFTRDFEDLVAWVAREMNKTAVKNLLHIAWTTVGHIIERVVARKLDRTRLERLRRIGIDEVPAVCVDEGIVIAGDFVVPSHAVVKVEFGKVVFDCKKLDKKLRQAIGHAHDAETEWLKSRVGTTIARRARQECLVYAPAAIASARRGNLGLKPRSSRRRRPSRSASKARARSAFEPSGGGAPTDANSVPSSGAS
ncbi:MAG: helix-turn-helix domain-containing protein [Deltaproteobacteria bacterium]